MQAPDTLYSEVFHALPEHIAVVDSHGRIVTTNKAWESFAVANGAANDPRVTVGANYLDVCTRSIERKDMHASKALEGIVAILDGGARYFSMDYPCHSPEEQRWFSMSAVPLVDGHQTGAVIAHTNVTTRTVSAMEIGHRFKNLLGLVQSIAILTMKASPEAFSDRFADRLQALARTQDLLVHNSWHRVSLEEIVTTELSHFSDLVGTRITIAGKHVQLTARAAQAIGMALHELTTNAAKYGALASQMGQISLTWDANPRTGQFTMTWAEHSNELIAKPTKRGFGSSIILDAIERSLDATVSLEYTRTGLTWSFSCLAKNALET